MAIKNLDLLLADEGTIGKKPTRGNDSQLDKQARVEVEKWFIYDSACKHSDYARNLGANKIINQYASRGKDPAAFKELIDCVSAFFTAYKSAGSRHSDDESWHPEKDLPYLVILEEPVIKKAIGRFYNYDEDRVRSLIKNGLNMIFNCGEQVDQRELQTAFNYVKPWTTYLGTEEIVEAVEIPLMADLTYLVADNLNLNHLTTPTPLIGVFDEGIAQEKDPVKRENLVKQRNEWARDDREIKQNNLECYEPGYRSQLKSFTRKMAFLKDILGDRYKPEIFKEIMGSAEFGDIETPAYFRTFFTEVQNGI